MKKTKDNNGITLIALIITIIVLLILAGVTISMVVGDNGVLTQAQTAKRKTEEAKFIEDSGMAYSEIYAEKSENGDYSEVTLSEVAIKLVERYGYENKIHTVINGDISKLELNETEVKVPQKGMKILFINLENNVDSQIYVEIKGSYYLLEKVNSDIILGEEKEILNKTIEVTSLDNNIAVATIVGNNVIISGKYQGDTTLNIKYNEISEKLNVSIREYLVDLVNIGEYVDIGINYQNEQKFIPNDDMFSTSELTGWRVLSKEGTGKDGIIKLISAGCPLTYNHTFRDSDLSISNLNNLNLIEITNSGKGFRKNGFDSNNLKELFSKNDCIDINKGIHSFGCNTDRDGKEGEFKLNEVERLYQEITGKEEKMINLKDIAGENKLRNSCSQKRK